RNGRVTIHFETLRTNSIDVTWEAVEFSRGGWENDGSVVCPADLAGAQFNFLIQRSGWLPSLAREIAVKMEVAGLSLAFDGKVCPLENLSEPIKTEEGDIL